MSKKLLYEFHYDYIKNKYGDNSRLLFTDTDSLVYRIETKDVSEDFIKGKKKKILIIIQISIKAKSIKKCVEYKDVLLNQKCLRHSMNGIQIEPL